MEKQVDRLADSEDLRRLGELIKGVRIAMLTTAEKDGSLRSRPMATQEVEFDGDLWFFTEAGSGKVDEVLGNRHVNVSYVSPEDQRYVSVTGTAQLIYDREKARRLWSPTYRIWFPRGLDDPDLALLKVRVERAEYWDAPSSKMVMLAGLVKSIVTGERYQAGEHGQIDVQH